MKSLLFIRVFSIYFSGLSYGNFYNSSSNDLKGELENLNSIYKKYENEEYGSKYYDIALFAFEAQLKRILNEFNFTNQELFEALNENQFFTIKSNDDKLIMISWEILDSGCHHSYKSLYRFKDDKKN